VVAGLAAIEGSPSFQRDEEMSTVYIRNHRGIETPFICLIPHD